MKKLLSLLGTIGLVAASSAVVTSCGEDFPSDMRTPTFTTTKYDIVKYGVPTKANFEHFMLSNGTLNWYDFKGQYEITGIRTIDDEIHVKISWKKGSSTDFSDYDFQVLCTSPIISNEVIQRNSKNSSATDQAKNVYNIRWISYYITRQCQKHAFIINDIRAKYLLYSKS